MSTRSTPNNLANYGVLSGQLFLYASGRSAFESPIALDGEVLNKKKCILLGGLSDGLLPVPYTQQLAEKCAETSWSLVQPILSSSYTGFGHGSLQRDCDEIEELMKFLVEHRNAAEFCLVGHSTGTQDIVFFMENGPKELCDLVSVVGLQAPVSDREGASSQPGYLENLELANDLVKRGDGNEMMPRGAFWAPITAQRYSDLHVKGGMDDYFSSDYTDTELAARLRHMGKYKNLRVLVAESGADEYIPSHVNTALLAQRLVAAMNTDCDPTSPVARELYLSTGNHNLSTNPDDAQEFVDALGDLFISTV